MARPKTLPETIQTRLPEGTRATLAAVLDPWETPQDFVRHAIVTAILAREQSRKEPS